jgi:hypothetical protein
MSGSMLALSADEREYGERFNERTKAEDDHQRSLLTVAARCRAERVSLINFTLATHAIFWAPPTTVGCQ